MDTLEDLREHGFQAGLAGRTVPGNAWLCETAATRAYLAGWLVGTLASLAPAAAMSPAVSGAIRATYTPASKETARPARKTRPRG